MTAPVTETPPPDDQTSPPVPDDEQDPAGAEALGDPGKQALDRMKEERNTARAEVRRLKAELEAAKQPPPPAPGDTPDAEQIKAEARREAIALANARILRAEIKSAAAGKLADPGDALKFLDLTAFEVDDDGSVDDEAIADAIAGLIKDRPYLSAQGPRFQGSADGTPRNGARPQQLTRADLQGMTAEQIEAARLAGRLDDLQGIKR